jgi:hypothetical protein
MGTSFAIPSASPPEHRFPFRHEEVVMTTRTARRRTPIVTKNDLLMLLNDDFARECRSIYSHAVYTERLRDVDAAAAAAIEAQGHLAVHAALVLCQLIYDFGGTVESPGDELNFVLNADRVADPNWEVETIHRLRQRVGQLRAIGEPGLAKRIRRIVAAKRAAPGLCELVE